MLTGSRAFMVVTPLWGLLLCLLFRRWLFWDIERFLIWSNVGTSSNTNSTNGGVGRMPRKAKHPCHHPGCPNLTESRFCEQHQKEENKQYEKYHRDPATRKRYGRAWKRIRDSFVQQHPLCELCKAEGKLTPTQEVHHKVPLSQDGTHDRNNLIALCKSCHSKIHAQHGDRWH